MKPTFKEWMSEQSEINAVGLLNIETCSPYIEKLNDEILRDVVNKVATLAGLHNQLAELCEQNNTATIQGMESLRRVIEDVRKSAICDGDKVQLGYLLVDKLHKVK